jgi:glycosyltransferase involved in cell wall biosynthesis
MMESWLGAASAASGVSVSNIRSHMKLLNDRPTPEEVRWVINHCTVGVYPYRSEGWCLPLLETLACAKPAIATAFSGPMTYLTSSNAHLISGVAVSAKDGIWFHGTGSWLEPNFTELRESARCVYNAWECGETIVNDNGLTAAERYSWATAAKRILHWLDTESASY